MTEQTTLEQAQAAWLSSVAKAEAAKKVWEAANDERILAQVLVNSLEAATPSNEVWESWKG